MPQLPCPSCRATLAIPDSALGKSVRCPKCTKVFVAEAPIEAVEVIAEVPALPPSDMPLAHPLPPTAAAPLSEVPLPIEPTPIWREAFLPPPAEEAPWNQPPNPLAFEEPHTPLIRMTNQARAQGKRAGSWLVMGAGLHIFVIICSVALSFVSGTFGNNLPRLIGQVFGLVLGIGAGVLILLGGTSVANLRNKVMGYVASILGLLFGALTGFGALAFCFISMQTMTGPRFHDAGVVILGTLFLLFTGISVCYLVGSILCLIVLGSPAAQGEFERHITYRR